MKTAILILAAATLSVVSCKPSKSEVPVAATSTESATPYPLDTCLVSGEKLGGMGKPYEFVYEGRQIKFCCKNCLPDFKEDPAKYLAKLK
jgi:YHS domain-containing protein